MYTSQDLDALVARATALWDAEPGEIAADRQRVDALRAAWAEAAELEAYLVPMAFTEYDLGLVERGFGNLYVQRGLTYKPEPTRHLGDAEQNPMDWLVITIAIRYRMALKLEEVNRLLWRQRDR